MTSEESNLQPITKGFLEILKSLESTKEEPWGPRILELYTQIRNLANSTYDISIVNQVKNELGQRGVSERLRIHYGNLYQRYERGILDELKKPYTLPSIMQGGGYVRDMLELCFNEFRHAQVRAPIKMLFIGSGAIPFGIIYFFYMTILASANRLEELALKLASWRESYADEILNDMNRVFYLVPHGEFSAVGIDHEEGMVSQSKSLLADLKLDPYVSIIKGRAEEFNIPPDINLILVAGNTTSRQEVLKNIIAQKTIGILQNEIKIILRTVAPNTLGELFYEPFGVLQIAELCKQNPNLSLLGSYSTAMHPAIYATTQVFILR